MQKNKVKKDIKRNIQVTSAYKHFVTNFIQLVSLQPVDQFLQTRLHCKAPNEGYLYICWIYKSNNKQLRYQGINNYKSFVG